MLTTTCPACIANDAAYQLRSTATAVGTASRFPWSSWSPWWGRHMRLWFGTCPECGIEVAGRNRSNFRDNATAHRAYFHGGHHA